MPLLQKVLDVGIFYTMVFGDALIAGAIRAQVFTVGQVNIEAHFSLTFLKGFLQSFDVFRFGEGFSIPVGYSGVAGVTWNRNVVLS